MIPVGSLQEITKSIKSLQINRIAGFFSILTTSKCTNFLKALEVRFRPATIAIPVLLRHEVNSLTPSLSTITDA